MTDISNLNSWPEGTSLLNIIDAEGPHDPVLIFGTEVALRALRDAIDKALIQGSSATEGTMTKDGEGFQAIIIKATEDQMETVPLHYSDDIYGDAGDPLPEWVATMVNGNRS